MLSITCLDHATETSLADMCPSRIDTGQASSRLARATSEPVTILRVSVNYCIYKQYIFTGQSVSLQTDNLNGLLRQSGLWRASSIENTFRRGTGSGFAELDQHLPGHGWPADGMTELLHDQRGIGEFRLLLPALARLSREQSRWLLLVNPPYIPYPPALVQAGIDLNRIVISQPKSPADYLWVLEKSLASESCSVVIAWPGHLHYQQIRRLQVASKDGHCWGVLFRHEKTARQASPAQLRLRIRPSPPHRDASAIRVKVLKRRGGWESDEITIHFADQLHRPMPDFSELIVHSQHAGLVTPNHMPGACADADTEAGVEHVPAES